MPQFSYKVSTAEEQIIEDTINAPDLESAKQQLLSSRYQILWIKPLKSSKGFGQISFGGIPLIEKANLCRYLATMLHAGLPLPEAVEIFANDSTNATLKDILHTTATQLQQGKNLSSVFEQYPKVFDQIIIALIKAGEMSGTLHKSLEYLAEYLYAEYKLRQKVRGAMMYPLIILLAMGGVGGLLVFFVLPKMAPVFLNMQVKLPIYTQIMLKSGMLINKYAYIVIPVMLVSLVAFLFFLTKPLGKKISLAAVRLIPAIKRLLNFLDLARFCRILSTLLSSGVPINEALQIVTTSMSQEHYKKAVAPFSQELQKGIPLAQLMRAYPKLFPSMTVRMIAAGERTGSIESMLNESAEYYDNEVEDTLANFANIIEPVLLLMVGIGVGVMVIAIIGPIYSLVGGIKQ